MLHGQALEVADFAKYLGVDISNGLSWKTLINRITANANRTLCLLKRNIKTQHTGIRTAAYSTLVHPHVEYASPVWSPYTQSYANKLEMVQRRAVRWVSNNYASYASVTQMQNDLGWRALIEDRSADARFILFYKIAYITQLNRLTRHMHPLNFIQIPTTASYFPLVIVLVLPDLDSFRSGVRTPSHCMP